MIPPSGYSGYLPVIQRVFASGVASYVHETGFDAFRVITGFTGLSAAQIDPYRLRYDPSRMQHSGAPRLFTTDRKEEAWSEALNHTGDGVIPPGTFEIGYYVTGRTLNHRRIEDQEYQALCFNPGDHSFSQAVSYYLESEGLSKQYDTHSWLTVAGAPFVLSGHVHGWQPWDSAVIQHRYTNPHAERAQL